MSISLRTAIKNALSDKYDKTNVLYFSILTIFFITATLFAMPNPEKAMDLSNYASMTLCYFISFVLAVLVMGIFMVAVNNGYREQNSIFPNLIKDFKHISLAGIQLYGGLILLYFVCFFIVMITMLFCIPIALIVIHFAKTIPALGVAAGILGVILYIVLILFYIYLIFGILFNFAKSLQFEDIINVKKALSFMKKVRKEFSIYFVKSFCFGIVMLIIGLLICLCVYVIVSLAVDELSEIQLLAIIAVVYTIFYIICTLVNIDLQVQFLTETKQYEINEPKKDNENEYLEDYDDYSEDDTNSKSTDYLDDYYDYPENSEE